MRKHNFAVAPSLKAKRGRKKSLHSIAYIFFLYQTFAPHGYLVASTVKRSALVNIRRKALLSSVGFRKRMLIHLHFDRLYPRFHPTFSIIPRLIPINSNKKMPLPPFKGCFDVSSLFLLRGEKELSVDVTE